MPPNTREDIKFKREKFTSFGVGSVPETYWEDELNKLHGVKVHAFYVHSEAKQVFSEIAHRQQGQCEALDINSSSGAARLTDLVTKEILRIAGGDNGNALVRAYERKFSHLA